MFGLPNDKLQPSKINGPFKVEITHSPGNTQKRRHSIANEDFSMETMSIPEFTDTTSNFGSVMKSKKKKKLSPITKIMKHEGTGSTQLKNIMSPKQVFLELEQVQPTSTRNEFKHINDRDRKELSNSRASKHSTSVSHNSTFNAQLAAFNNYEKRHLSTMRPYNNSPKYKKSQMVPLANLITQAQLKPPQKKNFTKDIK